MATSKPCRVSTTTADTISDLAAREHRTFIAQLDVVVAAGLKALGEPTHSPDPRNRDRDCGARTP